MPLVWARREHLNLRATTKSWARNKLKDSTKNGIGTEAPDFTLKDAYGSDWQLSSKRGGVVVLLFYAGDETPVCTRQMCSLRNRWQNYAATGAEIVGISPDSPKSHRSFIEHHKLPLRLLSDTDHKVADDYGARSLIPGKVARSVFVIDAKGVIRYRDVRPLGLFRPKDDDIIKAIREAQQ